MGGLLDHVAYVKYISILVCNSKDEIWFLFLTVIPCAISLPADLVRSLCQQRNVLTIHADWLCSRKPRTAAVPFNYFSFR